MTDRTGMKFLLPESDIQITPTEVEVVMRIITLDPQATEELSYERAVV
jgi:hypothetical protein